VTNKADADVILRDLIEILFADSFGCQCPEDELGVAYDTDQKFADDSGHTAAESTQPHRGSPDDEILNQNERSI